MITPASLAWDRYEKVDITKYKLDQDGEAYSSPNGGWIWWSDLLKYLERNHDQEEHF